MPKEPDPAEEAAASVSLSRTELTRLLLEGLDSGVPIPFTDDYMAQRIQLFRERMRRQRTQRSQGAIDPD